MSAYPFRKPNSYPFNGGSWGQGHPSSYGDPPPYNASLPPMSDNDWFEGPGDFDTYQDKPGWSQVAGRMCLIHTLFAPQTDHKPTPSLRLHDL
jgi:hypothetical protein